MNKKLLRGKDHVESEQINSLLIKNAPLGILMTDKNGVIVYENPYFAEKIIGVPKGKISMAVGMKLQEMPNVVAAGIDDDIRKLLKGRPIRNLVFPFVSIYKKRSVMSVEGVPLKDHTGKITGGLVMVSDVTEQRGVEELLRQSQKKLAITLKSIGDAVIVTDSEGKITFLNFIAQKITKWSEKSAIGQSLEKVFDIFNEKTGKKVVNPAFRVMQSGEIIGLGNHTVLVSRDGKKLSIEDSAAPIKDDQGKVAGVVLVFRDVTKKRKNEKKLLTIANTLKIITKCNEALIHIHDEEELLNAICKIIVDLGGYKFAWIGYAENDKNKTVRPIARAGFEKGYLESAKITWADTKRGQGPTGTAIRTGKLVVCNNMLTDPKFAPWKAIAIERGYASSISLPILINGLVGAVNIYASEPNAFDAESVKLLEQLTNDLSYGIKNIRINKKRKEAEEKLKETAATLQGTMNAIPDGIDIVDGNLNILWMNQTLVSIFGENSIGKKCYEVYKDDKKQCNSCPLKKAIKLGEVNKLDVSGVAGGKDFEITHTGILYHGKKAILEVFRDVTERNKIEKELLREKKFLDNIIDLNPNAIQIYDKTGYSLRVNKAYMKLFRFKGSKPPLDNYNWFEDPIAKKLGLHEYQQSIKKGNILEFKEMAYNPSWVMPELPDVNLVFHANAFPIMDSENKLDKFVLMYEDITERKKAEEAVRQSEKKYVELFNNAVDAIFIADPLTKKLIDCNKAAEKLIGYSRADILSMTAEDLHPKDLVEETMRRFKEQADGKTEQAITEVLTKNNKRVPVAINSSVVHIQNKPYVLGIFRDITKQKKVENEIKESEDRFKRIFENSGAGISLTGLDGRWLKVNKKLCEITGYSEKELLTKAYLQITYPEDIQKTKDFTREVITGKNKDYSIEKRYIHKNGRIIWVYLNVSLIRDPNNKPLYFEVVTHDITKQKNAEEKLKESEEKYRNLIANLPKTEYILVHRNGKLLWANDNTLAFLGYSREKIIGTSVFDYLEKEYQGIVLENMKKRMKGEKVGDYEIKINNKKGQMRDVLVRGTIISFEGQPAALLILSDISERKKSEQLLLENERELLQKNLDLIKFKLAVEGASDHIIIADPDGVIIYANKASEKITGYPIKEIIGNKPSLWGGQMPKEFYEKLWKTIKEDKVAFIGEINNKRKNGETYVAEVNISPILNSRGKINFFVGIERDITKLKELDRAKSEFVSVASHQLKTPLSGIKWLIEAVLKNRENNLTEQQFNDLKNIYENNERMISLVNDLLGISRIDSGKYALVNLNKVEIVPLVERVIRSLNYLVDGKKIRINFDNHLPQNYSLTIDEEKIQQVISNLITNAIKYSKSQGGAFEGSVEITAGLEDGWFIFSVSDNGIGIPIQNQRHIFEKFYRAENASTSQATGSGLGLYIAKYFVERHNGKIWFVSKEGVGTTFTFTLKSDLV